MLIARAPLRISLAGGGTDLPAYYESYGGLVVSTTINKFVYVHLSPNGSHHAQITSADCHAFYRDRHYLGRPPNGNGHLALQRAVLQEFDLHAGLDIFVATEVPPGTGLGSSSAVAVGLVRAIAAHVGQVLSRREIAELACRVELGKLQAPIGKQDQYAAAFGGLNAITLQRSGVAVEPIEIAAQLMERLQRRLLLFFTGAAHDSARILKEQQRASADDDPATIDRLTRIKAAAQACRGCLERGDLDGIGEVLHEGWQHKRLMAAGVTNPRIDELYEAARAQGALGGKIAGAGGGGFLLLYCREPQQDGLTEALEERGLQRMDFCFEPQGVAIGAVTDWA